MQFSEATTKGQAWGGESGHETGAGTSPGSSYVAGVPSSAPRSLQYGTAGGATAAHAQLGTVIGIDSKPVRVENIGV